LTMKKTLLSIFTMIASVTAIAQPSPQWLTNQQAVFPTAPNTATAKGIRFIDAVDQNVIWTIGYDGNAANRSYNWWSRSIDGGATFTGGNVLPDTLTYTLANLEGIDANTAWVSAFKKVVPGTSPPSSGQGGIFRTTNGGTSWQNMTASGMYTNVLSFCNIVSFFTPSIGITQGDPVNGGFEIWRTTNGGLSWSAIPAANIPAPNGSEFAIVNLYYKLGTSNLWFGTNAGRIYYTTNAGVNWSVSTVAASTTITEIAFTSPQVGICYAYNGTANLDVYRTTNGGASWTLISPIGNIGYADIIGIPGTGYFASFGSATGNAYLSYSTDNGDNWIDWGSVGIQYLTGDFVDPSTGWAGSFDYPTAGYTNLWKYSGAALSGTSTPLASFTMPSNICGPNATIMPANSTTSSPAPTFSWSSSPAGVLFSSSTASAPVMTFTTNTTYTIILVSTNTNGSSSSQQVVVVQNCAAPTASFMVGTTACNNVPFTTVNSSSGGSPAPSYSWTAVSPGTGVVTFTPNTVADNPTVVISTPGIYTINLQATNNVTTSAISQTVQVDDCRPVASFSINRTLIHFCDTNERKNIGTKNLTPTNSMAGVNSYTWNITPSSATQISPITGTTAVNGYSLNLKATATSSVFTVKLTAKNASGTNTSVLTFSVDYNMFSDYCEALKVALVERVNGTQLEVYPNPAHDLINVSLNGQESFAVTVTNILGSVVSSESSLKGESVSISLAGKPRGVYFVTVSAGNEKITKKIIVE
jgi:hypothetical protein